LKRLDAKKEDRRPKGDKELQARPRRIGIRVGPQADCGQQADAPQRRSAEKDPHQSNLDQPIAEVVFHEVDTKKPANESRLCIGKQRRRVRGYPWIGGWSMRRPEEGQGRGGGDLGSALPVSGHQFSQFESIPIAWAQRDPRLPQVSTVGKVRASLARKIGAAAAGSGDFPNLMVWPLHLLQDSNLQPASGQPKKESDEP